MLSMTAIDVIDSINAIELVVLGVALGASRSRVTNVMLIIYNLFMQYVTWRHGIKYKEADDLYKVGKITLTEFDEVIMSIYLVEGLAILAMAFACYLLLTKMSHLTSLVILSQGLLSLVMVLVTIAVNKLNMNLDYLFDMHSSFNSKFVIIYMLIAWICVYLSRRKLS